MWVKDENGSISGADIVGGIDPGTDIAEMLENDDDVGDRVVVCYRQAFPPMSGELWVRTVDVRDCDG